MPNNFSFTNKNNLVMKNIYFNFINNKPYFWALLLSICIGNSFIADAQVLKASSQRTSSYTPNKKMATLISSEIPI